MYTPEFFKLCDRITKILTNLEYIIYSIHAYNDVDNSHNVDNNKIYVKMYVLHKNDIVESDSNDHPTLEFQYDTQSRTLSNIKFDKCNGTGSIPDKWNDIAVTIGALDKVNDAIKKRPRQKS